MNKKFTLKNIFRNTNRMGLDEVIEEYGYMSSMHARKLQRELGLKSIKGLRLENLTGREWGTWGLHFPIDACYPEQVGTYNNNDNVLIVASCESGKFNYFLAMENKQGIDETIGRLESAGYRKSDKVRVFYNN